MTPAGYQLILDRCGGNQILLPKLERRNLLQDWREVYAAGLHLQKGRWKHGPYEWHVFSFEYAHALRGERALEAYEAEQPSAVIVCPEGPIKLDAVRLWDGELPDFRAEHDDVLVWPEDLAWTMAFTHEQSMGLGPYFCRREWVLTTRKRLRSKRRH